MQVFSKLLLSAAYTGNPPLIETALSANGVNIQILGSTPIQAIGIAFNQLTTTGNTVTINLSGSRFVIDQIYNGSVMAIIHLDGNYTTFTCQTAYSTVPLSAVIGPDRDVSTPESRRKWLYGYI